MVIQLGLLRVVPCGNIATTRRQCGVVMSDDYPSIEQFDALPIVESGPISQQGSATVWQRLVGPDDAGRYWVNYILIRRGSGPDYDYLDWHPREVERREVISVKWVEKPVTLELPK